MQSDNTVQTNKIMQKQIYSLLVKLEGTIQIVMNIHGPMELIKHQIFLKFYIE